MSLRLAAFALASSLTIGACASRDATHGPDGVVIPVSPLPARRRTSQPNDDEGAPPRAVRPKDPSFPVVTRSTLANGLAVAVVPSRALPLVQLRVVLGAGANYGGAAVGEITAELLSEGDRRAVIATIDTDVDFDRTVLRTEVTADHVEDALALLAERVRTPRFEAKALKLVEQREEDEAREKARSDGSWVATRAAFAALFDPCAEASLESCAHPYASFERTPSDVAAITLDLVNAFHARFYVPKNTEVIVVGDVDAGDVTRWVARSFGDWSAPMADAGAPALSFPAARPSFGPRVIVARRAKHAASDILVVSRAPPRSSPSFAAARVVTALLGDVPASRLSRALGGADPLARGARAFLVELAHGEQPLFAYGRTSTAKTGLAVEAILQQLAALTETIPTTELELARAFTSGALAMRIGGLGAVADMLVAQRSLGLADGSLDALRSAARDVSAEDAMAIARQMFHRDRALIVVAGDADFIAPILTHFGEVTVVDPVNDFRPERTLDADPSAPLEQPAEGAHLTP